MWAVLEIIFVFLFVDLFDNVGTLVAVGKKAGLFDAAGSIPRINRILFADASATVVGSLAGTSTVVSYIESAAGVVAGGRTGVTAIITGLLFIGSAVRRPGSRRDSHVGHGSGAHHRGIDDGDARRGDTVGAAAGGDSGVPDDTRHSADLQHCQRPGHSGSRPGPF